MGRYTSYFIGCFPDRPILPGFKRDCSLHAGRGQNARRRECFAGECGVWVAFALPKRHPLEALRHKGLRRVWHVWRFNWGVYPPPRSGGGSTEYHLPVFVFRPRSKTNASNATHASKPYRIRVSRVAFCLPKRHTCHPNATQTPPACRANRQSRLDE